MQRSASQLLSLIALALFALMAASAVGAVEPSSSGTTSGTTAVVAPEPALDASSTARVPANEAVSSQDAEVDLSTLELPVRPDFLAAVSEGGTCTPCSSQAQCAGACGGFGVCLRDFGLQCGSFPTDRYCFC